MSSSDVAPLIAPSILSADFAHLADEAAAVAGADWLHVDVMDNHFVPNLTLGLPVVQSLLKATDIPIDCHLMITDPDRWAIGYAEAGAYNVTVHAEAVADPISMAANLRAAGAKAGLSLKPGTDLDDWVDALKHYDTLLVMTVEPGFGGQSFMPEMMAQGAPGQVAGRHRAPDGRGAGRRRDQRRHHRAGRRGRRRLFRRGIGRLLRAGSGRRRRGPAGNRGGARPHPAGTASDPAAGLSEPA